MHSNSFTYRVRIAWISTDQNMPQILRAAIKKSYMEHPRTNWSGNRIGDDSIDRLSFVMPELARYKQFEDSVAWKKKHGWE